MDRRRRPRWAAAGVHGATAVRPDGENRRVDLTRLAWIMTVVACLIAVAILATEGYLGYAGVTFAVAVAAAVNL